MKVNKKLKMPMIIFGVLLLLAGITFRVVSYHNASEPNKDLIGSGAKFGDSYVACDLSRKAMRYNLISILCLLLGLGVITFASRMGQISGIKLTIACLFFIGCITLNVFVQTRLDNLYGKNEAPTGSGLTDCPDRIYAQFGRQKTVDTMLIHGSNACAIFGITALLL